MAQGETKSGKLPEWVFLMTMVTTCHKRDDGSFIAMPNGGRGAAFLLTDAELQTYEAWQRRIWQVGGKGDVSRLSRMLALVFLAIVGSLSVLVGHVSSDPKTAIPTSALYLAGASFAALLIWVAIETTARVRQQASEIKWTFPFPDAPKIRVGIWKKLTMTFRGISALQVMNWLFLVGSFVFGFELILISFSLAVALFGGGLQLFGNEGQIDPSYLKEITTLAGMWTSYVLLCLPFLSGLMFYSRFKKRYGKPLTLENLYLSETGRLSGAS